LLSSCSGGLPQRPMLERMAYAAMLHCALAATIKPAANRLIRRWLWKLGSAT
jgi:hypothetical protein